ncbi:MAG: PAS domain S-box protein [Ignavibacteria bacterium]|nr:PAS domain S-box protein [Ignavibacteria bacterium]
MENSKITRTPQNDNPQSLSSILERISDAFVALDTNWCYVFMNRKAGEIFNRDPLRMIGKHIWTEFPEGVGQPFYNAYYKAMEEQKYVYLEEYYPPYDKWFENHIYPSPDGLSIYFRDITQTKKQIILLQESEERFRQLFENSLDAILLTAPDGSIYSANPAASRLFGRSTEEIVKIGRNGLVDVNDPRLDIALKERAETGGFLGELTFLRKDGTKFPAELSTSLFLDHAGRQRTSMIIRDIEERKLTQEALRESEERLKEAQQTAKIGSWKYIPGKPLIWSDQMFELFSLPRNKQIDFEELSALLKLKYRGTSDSKTFQKVLESEDTEFETESAIHLSGGEIKTLYSRGKINRDSEGRILDAVGTTQDITERSLKEDQILNSKRELENLYQKINEIRENERTAISRELHDVLGQNLTALKIDLKNMQAEESANYEKFDIMIEIVNDSIKKVQQISSDLRPGILDDLGLPSAIDWYLEEFENRTKIKCSYKPEEIDIDNPQITTALYRILQEAMTNIIRHSKATNVIIKLYYANDNIVLDVKDNGVGMSMDKINDVKSLGLIGIRERLKQFNGNLKILSAYKEGVELNVKIPLI